jgi:hypothetical protein
MTRRRLSDASSVSLGEAEIRVIGTRGRKDGTNDSFAQPSSWNLIVETEAIAAAMRIQVSGKTRASPPSYNLHLSVNDKIQISINFYARLTDFSPHLISAGCSQQNSLGKIDEARYR